MSLTSATPLLGYERRQSKNLLTLPKIEHPSKRINTDEKYSLDIRGRSRDGQGSGKIIRTEIATPQSPRKVKRSASMKLEYIPEEKVRLPIFGTDSPLSARQTTKLVIDELETILRERIRSQLHDVRAKFRHAAQNEPNGKITRQALQHLIATIFGTQKQIGPNQIDKLLERLNLKHANKISFDEFLQAVFNGEDEIPDWISHQATPRGQSSSRKTATQMFLILKDKVRNRHKDLVALIPSLNGGPSTRIFKAQFHNALMDMGYRMKDPEFDKLWDQFDTDGFRAVTSDKFMKILTNESIGEETAPVTTNQENGEDEVSPTPTRNVRSSHSDTPRIHTSRGQLEEAQIQKWLNHKFPNGFSELEKALERLDTKQTGTLPRDRFLEELKRFGLKLEPNLLEFFLKRLNVDLSLTNDGVPYLEVINVFKQKTDPTRKRLNADNPVPAEETRQGTLERQIDLTLSRNYERVRDLLNRLDISRSGAVSANELRSIIEDLIDYTLKPDEYYQLLKQIPMDEHGRVKYKEYLNQVLDRSLELQERHQIRISKSPKYEFMPPKHIQEKVIPQQLKQKRREQENSFTESSVTEDDPQRTRSMDELHEMLKNVIRNRYKDVEDEFKKIDRGSYGELTPDLLYELLKRLSLQPAVTRSEVDIIWSRCHLKRDGNLDFYQFLREFGYSKRSAHYPNAKNNPPKKGDADFILTSNRLYGTSVLVHGAALNMIRSKWDELRREFTELDPYRTGYVQSDEFDDILSELCPSVNQEDLDMLKSRFQTQNDSRINYIRFLKRHAPIPELIGLVDESNKNPLPTIHERSPRIASDRSILPQVCNKLRRKLSDSYKQLRRTFKQQDPINSGSVPVKAFKEILTQFKCPLNDEEFYTLASHIDTRMDGTINYNYFLQQYVKNN